MDNENASKLHAQGYKSLILSVVPFLILGTYIFFDFRMMDYRLDLDTVWSGILI